MYSVRVSWHGSDSDHIAKWSLYKEILNDYSYKTTNKYVLHRLNPKSNNMPGI